MIEFKFVFVIFGFIFTSFANASGDTSNSDSILSRESFISEVKRGIELLSQYNDDETKEYYQSKLRQLFK